jgi:uncharacterized protein YdcH (DUF465 family)
MRVYVVDDGRRIWSAEVVKETPMCYMIDRETKKNHWQESWYISNRVWKEKDRWFKSLAEALDYLETAIKSAVTTREFQLNEERQRLEKLMKARVEFAEK